MSVPHVILWDPGSFVGGGVQFGSDQGPYEFGGALYTIVNKVDVNTFDSAVNVFKSVDAGLTWTAQDGANAPAFASAYWYDGNGHIYFIHDPSFSGLLIVQKFDCNTDTYGTDSASGPAFTNGGNPDGICAIRVLSDGTHVIAYRPTGGGLNIVELSSDGLTWGTPQSVSATSFEIILGICLVPGDRVFIIWQGNSFPRVTHSSEWAGGTLVGSAQDITDITTEGVFAQNNNISFPALYSTTLNAIVFALYNYKPLTSDPDTFKISLVIGTLGGSPLTWTRVDGPTAPLPMGADGDVSPRIAFNADESILYASLNQIPDTGIDGIIWRWSSTDGGTTWSDASILYDYETDPPAPPPTTVDGIENPTLHVLADGTIALVMGLGTTPIFSFCGVSYYLAEPVVPTVQTLELTKIVVGGPAVPGDWTLSAETGSPPTGISGAGHVGPSEVAAATYELDEVAFPGLTWNSETGTWQDNSHTWGGDYQAGAWDCGAAEMPTATSVVVPPGGTVACTITNTFIPTPPPPPPGPGNGEENPVGCWELLRIDVTLMPSRRLPTRGSVR